MLTVAYQDYKTKNHQLSSGSRWSVSSEPGLCCWLDLDSLVVQVFACDGQDLDKAALRKLSRWLDTFLKALKLSHRWRNLSNTMRESTTRIR